MRYRTVSNLSKVAELEKAETNWDARTHCLTAGPCDLSLVLPFTVYPKPSQPGQVTCPRWLEAVLDNLLGPRTPVTSGLVSFLGTWVGSLVGLINVISMFNMTYNN